MSCRGSLYALLAGPAALTWETGLLDICLGAARGLAHLHAHGIMHRDVSVAAWRVPLPRAAGTCMAQRAPCIAPCVGHL